jgi:hypothetical protein
LLVSIKASLQFLSAAELLGRARSAASPGHFNIRSGGLLPAREDVSWECLLGQLLALS